MTQYIDKDALLAEIERMIKHYSESAKEFGDEGYNDNVLMEQCKTNACKQILSFIDTLEVKEVDLEKEIELWMKFNVDTNGFFNTLEFAKHCFELGLESAQNCNNSKCEDLRDDGICNFASTRLGRTMRCGKIACSRRNKARKGE